MLRRRLISLVPRLHVPGNTAMCSTSAPSALDSLRQLRQVVRKTVSNDIYLSCWFDRHRPPTFSEQLAFTSDEKWKWSSWSKIFIFTSGHIAFLLAVWNFMLASGKKKILETRDMELLEGNQTSFSKDNYDFLESRRIVCKGLYDEKKSIYVARKRYRFIEDGYNLITPLVPISGDPESVQSPILVNRGWFPHPQSPKDEGPSGSENEPLNRLSTSAGQSANKSRWSFWYKKLLTTKVTETRIAVIPDQVIAVAYPCEVNIFNRVYDHASSKWVTDIPSLARACGYPEETICVEDLNVNVANPNNPLTLTADEHSNRGVKLFAMYIVTCIIMKILRPRRASVYKCEANF